MFVLLAGISAALAYLPLISARGLRALLGRLVRRIAEIYTAHVVILWISLAVLSIATSFFHRVDFMGREIPAWVPADPWGAAWSTVTLTLQPEYLDILPLYVVLLLGVPLFIALESLHRGTGLAMSIALWVASEITGLNFPSSRSPAGWYFDPFTWQVLFCIGLMAGITLLQGVSLPRSRWLTAAAIGYVLIALAATTPCHFRSVAHLCQVADSGSDVADLALRRIAHILALAYLATVVVPPKAAWLSSRFAQSIVLLGRNSLPVLPGRCDRCFVGINNACRIWNRVAMATGAQRRWWLRAVADGFLVGSKEGKLRATSIYWPPDWFHHCSAKNICCCRACKLCVTRRRCSRLLI